jgi:hypothetical protein
MVETIWTKLAAPHAGIEPSLRNSSQERNFLLQRPGGEMGSFASIAGTETALTSQFGRHAFENAALLRVSHTLYNYRVWVVETIWTKLAAPHAGIEPSLRKLVAEVADLSFCDGPYAAIRNDMVVRDFCSALKIDPRVAIAKIKTHVHRSDAVN